MRPAEYSKYMHLPYILRTTVYSHLVRISKQTNKNSSGDLFKQLSGLNDALIPSLDTNQSIALLSPTADSYGRLGGSQLASACSGKDPVYQGLRTESSPSGGSS